MLVKGAFGLYAGDGVGPDGKPMGLRGDEVVSW